MPVLHKLNDAYKSWNTNLVRLPRLARYNLGAKIDDLFTDCLELALLSGYAGREDKLALIKKLSVKLDLLKFFLKLLWELKALDTKKYLLIAAPLAEAGRMLGGWIKTFK